MARQLFRRCVGSRVGVALLTAVAVLTTASIMWAALPGQNGVIQGCTSSNGDLRLIDGTVETCRSNETAVSWSQWGIMGYEIVTTETVVVPAASSIVKRANCPPGKKVLSGGFHSNNLRIAMSLPQTSGVAPGWQVYAFGNGVDPGTLTVYAICAMATP